MRTPSLLQRVIAALLTLSVFATSIPTTAAATPAPTPFPEALISLNFDDGYESVYKNAFPILQKHGLRSTHYIVSGRLDWTKYMTTAQVLEMQKRGHEIGAHTRTHRKLTLLSEQ